MHRLLHDGDSAFNEAVRASLRGVLFGTAAGCSVQCHRDAEALQPRVAQFLLVNSGGPAQRRSNSVGSSTFSANRSLGFSFATKS